MLEDSLPVALFLVGRIGCDGYFCRVQLASVSLSCSRHKLLTENQAACLCQISCRAPGGGRVILLCVENH